MTIRRPGHSPRKAQPGPGATSGPADRGRPLPRWAPIAACGAWFPLWFLTPGLLGDGVGHLLTDDPAASILVETIVALVAGIGLTLSHRRRNRVLFARSWSVWVYGRPLALAVALPFHYELALPVFLYMGWMTVSVFWQDYLTFGLLQSYLSESLPAWGAAVVSAVVFCLGHALAIPHHFGPGHALAGLAILGLGLGLASLRVWLGSLHLILALHLSFYFIFA